MKNLLTRTLFISLLSLALMPSGIQAYDTAVGKKFAKRIAIGLITGSAFLSTHETLIQLEIKTNYPVSSIVVAGSVACILTKEIDTIYGTLMGTIIGTIVGIRAERMTEEEFIKPILTGAVTGAAIGYKIGEKIEKIIKIIKKLLYRNMPTRT